MTPLRKKMIDDMKVRRLSLKTQGLYVSAVAGLAKHYNQSPDLLDKDKIQAYLLYLMEDRELAWSTCNVAVAGMRFFYTQTLGWDSMRLGIPPMKTQKKLPEIFSFDEIERLLKCASNLKNRAVLMTTYAAGLRVSEVVSLQLSDIDSKRMTIRVRQGKGNKDRYTILSERLLAELRAYYREYKPPFWLFYGTYTNEPDDVLHCKGESGHNKERRHSYPQALFCHTSAGSRSGPQDHPVVDGAHLDNNDNGLSACHEQATGCYQEPSGPYRNTGYKEIA
jgi:integrase